MSELKWAENKMPKTDDKNLPIMFYRGGKKSKSFPSELPSIYTNTIIRI